MHLSIRSIAVCFISLLVAGCNSGMMVRSQGGEIFTRAGLALGEVAVGAHTAVAGDAFGMKRGEETRVLDVRSHEQNGQSFSTVLVRHEYRN